MHPEPENQTPEGGGSGRLALGRYRIEARLGSGGMAEIYRARDLELTRLVALKVAHPALAADPVFVERLRREAQAVAALSHPNVVTLYDYGEADGSPTLVMELVEGPSLAEMLRQEGALPLERALDIADQVLAALEHAHARGIIHRDVKPQNILLDHQGRAKLADFGIAQAAASASITHSGEVFGSVHYLAPERLTGASASPATDIYALGVVVYRMVAGRLPFEADLPSAIAAQQLEQPPTPPSTLRTDTPPWLDRVVLTALAKAPGARYASVSRMRRALQARDELAHDARTTRIEVSPPARPQADRPRRPFMPARRTRWIASVLGLLGGLALVFSFTFALSGDATSDEPPLPVVIPTPRPAAPTAIALASDNPPTATATPQSSPTPRPTPRPALAEAQALIEDRGDTRGRDGKAERELAKKLSDIEKRLDQGKTDEARKKADELIADVQKRARKRELDPALGEKLVALLRAFTRET